ncbi:protein MOTHER of FT and TFL1-like isoform X2 [Musa acuminata AAA Group]|uniref:protein MOTHER of FT and TFL1-like isoform X2 n=1 Tax=Musa acuminata AAA Group TaxID=214697 RepID=UPI0031E2BE97
MAGYVDPLVVGRVIGDVVDLFVPTINMTVSFGSKHVNNGCDIKPSMAANPPSVYISGQQSDLYTLVMTDPDAPSPSDPTMREWLHWGGGGAVHGTCAACGNPQVRAGSVPAEVAAAGGGVAGHARQLQHAMVRCPARPQLPRRHRLLQLAEGASEPTPLRRETMF